MAVVLWREVGKTEQAQENFEKALRILEAEPESVKLAALYAARASMSYFTEDVTKARSWAEKALELAKKLNAFEVIASSYVDLGLVFGATGESKEAVECLEKALKIALDNGHIDIALRAYNNLAIHLPAEENERKLECFEKGLELAKKVGHIQFTSWCGVMLASMYFGMGNSDKVITLTEESDALNRKIGNLFNLSNSTLFLGAFYHASGELSKGEQYLKESLSISQKINNTQQISSGYGFLGWCYYDKGEYAKAREYFEKMSEIDEKSGKKARQMSGYQWVAMNLIELGEVDKARNLLDDLHKFAHEKQDRQLVADEDATRAMLLRAEKKWNESIELFEKSLQEYEALGARKWNVYWLAKIVLYEYARMYLERNQEGDKEKAQNLLSQALEIYQKLGAKKDIEKIESKMAYTETGKQTISEREPATITVSETLPDYVKTGYGELDKSLFGGIPRNYAVMLTSPSCDERDLLIKKFLETGATKGEVTFYVTIDPGEVKTLAEDFPSNFYLFICNSQADTIVKDLPNVFKLKGVENLNDINMALTSTIRKLDPSLKGPRRICIEIIPDVLLQHQAVQTRRWLSAFIPELRTNDFTTLAILDPEMHSPQEVRAILDLFEGEISLYENETEQGLQKFLKIKKMQNRRYVESEVPLQKEKLQE
jgi:tetratricopeptide (TPR) repeat protein